MISWDCAPTFSLFLRKVRERPISTDLIDGLVSHTELRPLLASYLGFLGGLRLLFGVLWVGCGLGGGLGLFLGVSVSAAADVGAKFGLFVVGCVESSGASEGLALGSLHCDLLCDPFHTRLA